LSAHQEQKRVVLFSHNSNLSGAPISLSQLARKLPQYGYTPLLILPKPGSIEELLTKWKIEYIVLKRPQAFFEFRKTVKHEDPVLIHVNSLVRTWPVLMARIMRRPVVWHVREHIGEKRFYAWLIHALADRVICISHNQLRLFEKFKNTSMVYNGVDLEQFKDVQAASLPVPKNAIMVSYIGSIEPRKGLDVLVKAAGLLGTNRPVHFVIVGDATAGNREYLKKVKKLINLYELEQRCHFLGFRNDIPEILAATDIFCHPANKEEFGRVVIEAMASSVPVIASKIGEIPNMVEDGVSGILVDRDDHVGLGEAILKLLQDASLRTKMGNSGLQRVRSGFSLDTHTREVVSVYESLLREKG
jgi:glycosyltransferase involved in cell wall biosynthesis